MRLNFRYLQRLTQHDIQSLHSAIPLFLCPALPSRPQVRPLQKKQVTRSVSTSARRRTAAPSATTVEHDTLEHVNFVPTGDRALPLSCPGCGAPTQTVAPNEAGFYTLTRAGVRAYLKRGGNDGQVNEDNVYSSVLRNADPKLLEQLGLKEDTAQSPPDNTEPSVPICDRCHNLIHHHSGLPIHHPSLQAIEATIAESPYKYNHIYHVLDAADFPMSLIPNLQRHLNLAPMRTQNRRSKTHKFVRGRVAEVSFIITRSDLLAPKKEQVDSLMPYMIEVLRDALGSSARKARLGNVRCVSSKRGWWTKEVKEDIWKRGGGGWLVGKVNVGKSNLFEVVFPKGRNEDVNIDRLRNEARLAGMQKAVDLGIDLDMSPSVIPETTTDNTQADEFFDEGTTDSASLLPPAQRETPYPVMPIVSSLPGTTASPIRVPFGGGKGELIDLPGLARSNLEKYVRPEHRPDLVMKSRVTPERLTIKPGQSFLLGGGLIRITPITPDLIFLMHAFVPVKPHVTSTEKAIGIQTGERGSGIHNITEPSAKEMIASAGKFQLKWDVTKKQAGPLTSPSAVKLKAAQLPFIVYSADILIEGVGWVEVVAQVRRRNRKAGAASGNEAQAEDQSPMVDHLSPKEAEPEFPEVEVFSPEGKFIGVRRPMSAYLLGGTKPRPANSRKTRPRQSMRSVKHQRSKSS